MACFRILETLIQANNERESVFRVWIVRGNLSPGDSFMVLDAGHKFVVPITEIKKENEKFFLICDFRIGWQNQFANATVDTDSDNPSEQFFYNNSYKCIEYVRA
jgi:hypothetical protein